MGSSERPSRQKIESRLLNSGLDDIVRANSGITAREKLVLRLQTPYAMLAFIAALILGAAWAAVQATMTSKTALSSFFVFDAATALGVVLLVAACLEARSRKGRRAARRLAVSGSAGVAVLAVSPYVLVLLLGDKIGLTRAASPWPAHGGYAQAAPAHLGLIMLFSGVGGLEAHYNLVSRTGSTVRSARRSLLRTTHDVLWTLPIVIAALFILAFADELWKVVGQLNLPRLLALNGLLVLCVFAFTRTLAREKARTTMDEHPDVPPEMWDPAVPALPAASPHDDDLEALAAAGVAPHELEKTEDIQSLLVRQWRIQIGTRIVLAGLVIALLILIVTALTVNKPILEEWTRLQDKSNPAQHGWAPIAGLYFTWKHVELSVLLGAFAMVVFAGLALADDKVCERLLQPERERLKVLLLLAGTYQEAVKEELWRGHPGDDWATKAAFIADDPARRNAIPVSFGKRWRSDTAASRWRCAWIRPTGELYVYRSRPPGRLEILAVCDDEEKLREALDGWSKHEREECSLDWLRDHAKALVPAEAAPGAVPVGAG